MDENNNTSGYTKCLSALTLMGDIYFRSSHRLNLETCVKLDELINSKKLKLNDLDVNLCQALIKVNIDNLKIFEDFEIDQTKYNLNYQQTGHYDPNFLTYFIRKWFDLNDGKNGEIKQEDLKWDFKAAEIDLIPIKFDYENSKYDFFQKYPHILNYELFVGNIAPEMDNDKLRLKFEKYGKINYFIIKKDVASKNYFGFIGFADYYCGQKALENLSEFEVLPKKRIIVEISQQQQKKIFFDKVPYHLTKKKLFEIYSKHFENIQTLFLYEKKDDNYKQCFLEFDTRHQANIARSKLSTIEINYEIVKKEDESSDEFKYTYDKRKIFIKNVNSNTTTDEVYSHFNTFGKIVFIRKIEKYAIIKYEDEASALEAINQKNKTFLGPNRINICYGRIERKIKKSSTNELKRKCNDNDDNDGDDDDDKSDKENKKPKI
ncbi:unnamed protein product [Brachionus calyciflorus]|uniref:RRM domain-containing protein n=1 Tax=Brachionus calyciflorus TaxID=104777 RepID=A0A813M4J9_9BILA|nr:unnamed protein product [Brachionus calyciflorus]